MKRAKVKVFIIENDTYLTQLISSHLAHSAIYDFSIRVSMRLNSALESLLDNPADIIILDLTLPDVQGLETIDVLRNHFPDVPVIITAEKHDQTLAIEALRRGAQEYFIKDQLDPRLMERIINYLLERVHAQKVLLSHKEESETIFHSVPAMIWYKDKNNIILRANQLAAESIGLTVKEVEGKNTYDLYPQYAKKYHEDDLEVIRTGKPKLGIIEPYEVPSGEEIWVRTDKLPYRNNQGEIMGVVIFAQEITALKKMEQDLIQRENRLLTQSNVLVDLAKSKILISGNLSAALSEITEVAATTLEVERVSVWLYRNGTASIYCADSYEVGTQSHLSGMELTDEKHAAYFKGLENHRFIAADNALEDERTQEFCEAYLKPQGITSILDAPIRIRGRTVGVICHEHVGMPRKWSIEEQNFVGSLSDLVALAIESHERKRTEEKLNHLSYYDPLTDLPNRVLFNDRLSQAMIRARRREKRVGIIILDLDHFKRINDTLGHRVGDDLLQLVAARLKQTLYESDTLTHAAGDEFMMLLPELNKSGDSVKVADKLMRAFKAPFQVGGHELFMTASMGIAVFPGDGVDNVTLLKNADTAMFQAKERGRNNYKLYSSTMSVKVFERLILENSLRRAIEKNELDVYYQPQVCLQTRKVLSVEALLRWRHPHLGMVGPAEFIPIAEETGLIVPIGEWVMKRSCQQIMNWIKDGYKPINISVNVSDRQFHYANIVEVVERSLHETKLPATYLELEMTESMIMRNMKETVETLNRLKRMGLRISIDDFGTGHSSLNYLKRFPLDCLKIDRSFVNDVVTNPEDAAIAKAIISMAHNLRLRVVAEGVETKEQLNFLRDHRCDMMQGFYFCEPRPADEIEKFLQKAEPNAQGSEVVA